MTTTEKTRTNRSSNTNSMVVSKTTDGTVNNVNDTIKETEMSLNDITPKNSFDNMLSVNEIVNFMNNGDDEDSEEPEYDEDSDATDEGINDYDDPNYADSDTNQKRKRTSAGCRRGSGSAPNKKRAKVLEVEVVAEILLEEEEDEHPLEPTEEELNQTYQKKHLRGWYKKCNELKTYRKKHGHSNVPKKDPKLGEVS